MLKAVLAGYLVMSVITFIVFAWDKRASGRGDRRTPERTLHLLALALGWPGALAAVHLLRHKSAKPRFKAILWVIVALHVAAWAFVLYVRRPR